MRVQARMCEKVAGRRNLATFCFHSRALVVNCERGDETVATDLEKLYSQHIKPLPPADRLRLLAMMAQGLTNSEAANGQQAKRSILELGGLGKEIWEGIDAQEYVNELRSEWDHRP
ncbi:MAG: hypothetical protein QOE33_2269 [Acidobacteriota bacterium]|nr:hypothetical protein [Acidobacteriota bacterium]